MHALQDLNWATYSRIFDKDSNGSWVNGLQGNSYVHFKGNELTKQNLSLAGGRFEQSPISMLAFPGHWDLAKTEAKTTYLIEQMYCHDTMVDRHPCWLIYNLSPCNGGCYNGTVIDSIFEDTWGTETYTKWTGGTYMFWADRTQIVRSSFHDNGLRDSTETGKSIGTIHLDIHDWAAMAHVSVTGGVAMAGGAVALLGAGTFEITNCLFEGNVATQSGGAIFFQASSLAVVGSVFLMNKVHLERDTEVDILVRVFTGSIGLGSYPEEAFPLWKLDGAAPAYDLNAPVVQRSDDRLDIVSQPNDGDVAEGETVYGMDYVPTASNYTAVNYSVTAVNYSYHPENTYAVESTYSQVIRTTAGTHRLWHGILACRAAWATDWQGGYIEVIGMLTKVYPVMVDYRVVPDSNGRILDEGCYTGGQHAEMEEPYCAHGFKFWSYSDFTVPFGEGGGIMGQGGGVISISDSVFSQNTAGFGEAIRTDDIRDLAVRNTEFLGNCTPNAVLIDSTPDYSCDTHPCETGHRCNLVCQSLRCVPCAVNQIGEDGIRCLQCEPGKTPAANRSSCELCKLGKHSTNGLCYTCDPGKISTAARDACDPCGNGTVATDDGSSCERCAPGTEPDASNSKCVMCDDRSFSVDGQCKECNDGSMVATSNRTSCECPGSSYNSTSLHTKVSVQCIVHSHQRTDDGRFTAPSCDPDRNCDVVCTVLANDPAKRCLSVEEASEIVVISKGWSVQGAYRDQASAGSVTVDEWPYWVGSELTTSDGIAPFVFRCPNKDACLHGGICNTKHGYTGPLCATCADGFGLLPGNRCEPCTAISQSPEFLLTLAVLGSIATAIHFAMEINKRHHAQSKDKEIVAEIENPVADASESFETAVDNQDKSRPVLLGSHSGYLLYQSLLQPIRILVGYLQVVTHLGIVLDVELPTFTQKLFDTLSPFAVDVESIIQLDCLDQDLSFWHVWLLRVFVVPGVMSAVVAIRFLITWERGEVALAASQIKAELFFVLFIIYPGLCNRAFQIYNCRGLGNFDVLVEDYSVDCDTKQHGFYKVVSAFVIVPVALGTPAVLVWMMKTRRKEYGNGSVTDAFVAKRVAQELVVDESIALDSIRDISTGREYSFLINSFKSHLNYWEGIDMVRKMSLVGLLVVAGRGTVLQLYLAIFVAAAALSSQIYFQPYKHNIDNLFKITVEVSLFITVVTALATYGLSQGEMRTFEDHEYENAVLIYDIVLLGSVVSIFVMFCLSIRSKWQMLCTVFGDSESGLRLAFPKQRRAMSLLQLGLTTPSDMKVLSEYFAKLEDKVTMSNDVFISYRVASDAALARAVHDALSEVVLPDSNKNIRCYLDQTKLVDGERWDVGFMDGLVNSTVVVPIISAECLAPMMKLDCDSADEAVDNVLLEWSAALELHERDDTSVVSVLPLLVGKDGRDLFVDAAKQFGGVDALPSVTSAATMTKLEKHLASTTDTGSIENLKMLVNNGSEDEGTEITVVSVVKSLLLFQGAKLTSSTKEGVAEVVERITEAVNNARWKKQANALRVSRVQKGGPLLEEE